jgi:hypothetical protein
MKNRAPEVLAVMLLWLALILLVHQRLFRNGVWFDFGEFWSHEALIACCIVAAIALVIGKYLGR